MEFPPPHFLADFLGSLVADCGQETNEVFTPVVFGSPGPELVAQEGKLLVLVRSSSVVILAVNDFGFLEIKLQSAFGQSHNDSLA
jgi:hypothetical protein